MQTQASRALRASPRVRATFTAIAAVLALSACGGGGSAAPTLTVTADTTDTTPSGHTIALYAQLTNSSETPTWSLEGPGRLMPPIDSGGYTYVPPDEEDDDQGGTAVVTVSAAGLSRQVTLNVAAVAVPGHHWSLLAAPQPGWAGLATDGSTFVAVGGQGGIATSTDGTHWTERDDPAGHPMAAVAHGPAGWIAVSDDGTVLASSDAQSWLPSAARLPSIAPSVAIKGALYANGRYLVYGESGTWTSLDGVAWTASPGQQWDTVTGGPAGFVGQDTGGALWNSADGLAWTPQTSSASYYGLAFAGGSFYVTDGSSVLASPDGRSWTAASAWTRAVPARIASAGDKLYAWTFLGAPGSCSTAAENLASSADGATWDYLCTFDLATVSHVAAGANAFVASSFDGSILGGPDAAHLSVARPKGLGDLVFADIVGSRYVAGEGALVASSSDGANWNRAGLPGTAEPAARVIAHSPDGLLVVGGVMDGVTSHTAPMLAYSSDAQHWTISPAALADTDTVTGLVHDGQRFVAMGDTGIARTSADGHAWTNAGTAAPGAGRAFRALAAGNGRYVAVGTGGLIATSTDAKTWTIAPTQNTLDATPRPLDLSGVAYNGHVFIAVGAGGLAATSADGIHWSVAATASTAMLNAVAMTPGGEIVIAVGAGGVTQTSADGLHWTVRPSPDHRTLNAVAISGDRALAVGNDSFMQLSTH